MCLWWQTHSYTKPGLFLTSQDTHNHPLALEEPARHIAKSWQWAKLMLCNYEGLVLEVSLNKVLWNPRRREGDRKWESLRGWMNPALCSTIQRRIKESSILLIRELQSQTHFRMSSFQADVGKINKWIYKPFLSITMCVVFWKFDSPFKCWTKRPANVSVIDKCSSTEFKKIWEECSRQKHSRPDSLRSKIPHLWSHLYYHHYRCSVPGWTSKEPVLCWYWSLAEKPDTWHRGRHSLTFEELTEN